MVFGEIEKQNYIQKVQKNMNTFFEVIKRPYRNNMYFAILDLDPHNKSTSAEELFV